MKSPLATQTNKELIYSILKNKILNGQLQGGQQIRVAEIAQAHHVSGTPVREALIQLDGEGFISYAPYRGAIVRNLSKKDVKEIFLIRSVLECLALDVALQRMTEDKYAAALDLAERGIHEEDPAKLSTINWEFHSYMYRQAELPKLYQMIDSLRAPIVRYVRIYHQMVDRKHHHSTHKEIVLAGMAGDRERAVSLLRESLANACNRISHFIADE